MIIIFSTSDVISFLKIIFLNSVPSAISSKEHLAFYLLSNIFGPTITKGFLKSLSIYLLKTWNIFAALEGQTI